MVLPLLDGQGRHTGHWLHYDQAMCEAWKLGDSLLRQFQEGGGWHPLALGSCSLSRRCWKPCSNCQKSQEDQVGDPSVQNIKLMLEMRSGRRHKTHTSCFEQPSLCRLFATASLCRQQRAASISFWLFCVSATNKCWLVSMISFHRCFGS